MSTPAAAAPADRLAATLAAVDALADRLVLDVDSNPAFRVHGPGLLHGRSAEVAATVADAVAAVWAVFPELSEWRSAAASVTSPAQARRALGLPVVIGGQPLSAEVAVARAGALLDRAEGDAERLAAARDDVERRAAGLADRLATARGALRADEPREGGLDADEPGQGGPGAGGPRQGGPGTAARAGSGTSASGGPATLDAIVEWAAAARRDPMSPPPADRVEAAVARCEREAGVTLELQDRRHRAADRLPALAGELDDAAATLADLPRRLREQVGVQVTAPNDLLPRAAAVAGRLRRVAAGPGLAATVPALDRAEGLALGAEQLLEELHTTTAAQGAPLAERAALAGMLGGYRAKAAALGVDDDAVVLGAADAAAQALRAVPTDLGSCRGPLARLRALLDAEVDPMGPIDRGDRADFAVEVFARAGGGGEGAGPDTGPGSGPGSGRGSGPKVEPRSPVGPRAEVNAIVTVTAPPGAALGPPVRAEVVIVDRSGSMDGPPAKMAAAREAVANALDRLPDGTLFAVVAGNSEATLLYPTGGTIALARADARSRAEARGAVAALGAQGATEMSRWLGLARRLLAAAPEGNRHAVLFADGRNAGGDVGLVERELDAGAPVYRCDCLGLGPDAGWDDLRRIAEGLHGSFAVVAEPSDLAFEVGELIDRSLARPGLDARLRVQVDDGTEVRLARPVAPAVGTPAARRGGPRPPTRLDDHTVEVIVGEWAGRSTDVLLCLAVPVPDPAVPVPDPGVPAPARVALVLDGEQGPWVPVSLPRLAGG